MASKAIIPRPHWRLAAATTATAGNPLDVVVPGAAEEEPGLVMGFARIRTAGTTITLLAEESINGVTWTAVSTSGQTASQTITAAGIYPYVFKPTKSKVRLSNVTATGNFTGEAYLMAIRPGRRST